MYVGIYVSVHIGLPEEVRLETVKDLGVFLFFLIFFFIEDQHVII